MARTKTSTSSASKEKVAYVSGEVGKPNQSVAAIREQYKQEAEKQKRHFDEAIEGLKKLRDPNKQSSLVFNNFDRESIRNYLQNPANNEDNLRNAAKYLYYRNQVLFRLVHWYSSMWDLRCRQIIPSYTFTKENSPDKMLKQYENTLNVLETYNIHGNWHDVALRCYLEDACFTIWFRDDDNAFFYILDPSECKIDGRYFTGDFSYSIDMSKWRSNQRRELAEWLGSPISDMLAEYDRTGTKYIHMPDEYGAAFKFNSDRPDLVIPPFAPLLQAIATLNDTADLQALKDQASVYKLLLVPMKVLSGAKNSDDFEITPDLLIDYYKQMLEVLPEYVAAAPIPGEVTNDNVIDFSTTSVDKDIDRLQQSQDTVMATSGGGAVLNASTITSTAAFNAWLKSESEFAISSLLPQIEGFTNRMLTYDVSGEPCKVRYFECTVYTKQELAENLLESCQYSYSNRLAYNTLLGISEKATIATQFLENQVLKLPETMIYPLQSSYTTSSDGEVGQGRDTIPDDELEPSSDRSRNA